MKIKKLDIKGFTHDFMVVAFMAIFVIGGIGYLVSSHADTSTAPSGQWKALGSVSLTSQNQTVAAYACKFSTSSANTVWEVKGYYTLANSYKVANSWTASITNTGTDPYPGYKTASGYFSDTTTPNVTVTSYVYSSANNYLNFGYNGGSGASGNIVTAVRVGNLPTCSNDGVVTVPPVPAGYTDIGTIAASSLYNVKVPPATNEQPNMTIYACLNATSSVVQEVGVLSYPVPQASSNAWYTALDLSSSNTTDTPVQTKAATYHYSNNSWVNNGGPSGSVNETTVTTSNLVQPGAVTNYYVWASGSYGDATWPTITNYPNVTALANCT